MRILVAVCLVLWTGCVVPLHPTPAIPEAVKGHPRPITRLAFSRDGRVLVSASHDGPVVQWDVETERPIAELVAYRKGLRSIALSPDGETLALGSQDGTVVLLDVRSRNPIGAPFVAHKGKVASLAFSPDGRTLASGGHDGTVVFWSLGDTPSIAGRLSLAGGEVGRIAFHPGGGLVAAATSQVIAFRDPVTLEPLAPGIVKTEGSLSDLAFSADGRLLGRCGGKVLLWDVVEQRLLWSDAYYGLGLAISPDGRTLALGSWGGAVNLWDLPSSHMTHRLTGHSLSRMFAALTPSYGGTSEWREVKAVAFSPDGRMLVSGADDGTLIFWDAATALPIAPGGSAEKPEAAPAP